MVVIVIFAIAVLALGLAFITGLFGNMGKIIPKPQPSLNPPSQQEPFTISADKLTLKHGEGDIIKIGIYNVGVESEKYKMQAVGDCENSNLFTITPSNDKVLSIDVKQQEISGWSLLIRVLKTTPNGDYSCRIEGFSIGEDGNADGVYSYNKDLFIVVS